MDKASPAIRVITDVMKVKFRSAPGLITGSRFKGQQPIHIFELAINGRDFTPVDNFRGCFHVLCNQVWEKHCTLPKSQELVIEMSER